MPDMIKELKERCRFVYVFKSILIPLSLVGILSISVDVSAQQKYLLELKRVDKGSAGEQDIMLLPREFSAKEECVQYLEKRLLTSLQTKGYIAASIDSVAIGEKSAFVSLHLGLRYEWGNILVDSIALKAIKMQQPEWEINKGAPLNIESVVDLKERLLQLLEEHGYPFAVVRLDRDRKSTR